MIDTLKNKLRHVKILSYYLRKNELKKLKQLEVLFVYKDNDLGFVHRGKRYSQLLDTINQDLEKYNIKTGTLSENHTKYKSKSKYGNVYSINNLFNYAHIITKYNKIFYGDVFRNSATELEIYIDMWLRIIDRTKPKYIIGIQPSLELCIASKLRSIEVADLQHGVYSNESYYGEHARAKYGQMGWPNILLCWDIDSENWAKQHIDQYVDTKVIGNPWVNRFIKQNINDDIVKSEMENFPNFKSNLKNILVSLQYDANGDDVNDLDVPLALLDLIRSKEKKYNWLLRIHPVTMNTLGFKYINQKFNKIFGNRDNIDWEKSSSAALPVILKNTDLHFTWASAVTIEASWFGIRTALLSNDVSNLKKYFRKQLENGYAEILSNRTNEIENWITQNISKPKTMNYSDMYITNYDSYLEEIVNKIRDN